MESDKLSELADVGLGYKSLQNDFFYVTADTVSTYGIESQFLMPIVLMSDFDDSRFIQRTTGSQQIFVCSESERDLRSTGAMRYIRAMQDRPAGRKKQSGKPATMKEALAAQSGSLWYAPKATPHASKLWYRKAIDRNFAPFVFDRPTVVDQRCNFITSKDTRLDDPVAAAVSSTVFSLAVESEGVAALGAGALEMRTGFLRSLPILDVRKLSASTLDQIVNAARAAWLQPPFDWTLSAGPTIGDPIRELDTLVLRSLRTAVALDQIYRELGETCRARIAVGKARAVAAKDSEAENIGELATAIADSVRPLLDGKQFPESFLCSPSRTINIDLGTDYAHVVVETVLTQSSVTVHDGNGAVIQTYKVPSAVAECVVRAVLLGRRRFRAPASVTEARTAVAAFLVWFGEVNQRLEDAVRDSSVGTRFHHELIDASCRKLGIDRRAGAAEPPGDVELRPARAP